MRPELQRQTQVDWQQALLTGAIQPEWPAPPGILALMSGRAGGVSALPFDSLNLRPPALGGDAVDVPAAVLENQHRFALALGAQPVWLEQVHGSAVVRLRREHLLAGAPLPRADASVTTEAGLACAVLVADCLPLLLCSQSGRAVGAVHAGWRGLSLGLIEHSVAMLCEAAGCAPNQVLAWLGPCIGPTAFEVGADVLQAFGQQPETADQALFRSSQRADGSARWRADLAALARQRLATLGVLVVSGGRWCTVTDRSRFFSFRRDGQTGRLAAAVALRAG